MGSITAIGGFVSPEISPFSGIHTSEWDNGSIGLLDIQIPALFVCFLIMNESGKGEDCVVVHSSFQENKEFR